MSKAKFEQQLARAVFPWIQGWPHENLVAAKAVAFKEALQPEFKEYAKQVIKNAQTLALELQKNGFRIISNWTDNHLILLDVFWSVWVTWKEAEVALEKIWLSVNKNMIPYDPRKPLDPSWIRIWTPAATTRWMKETEMLQIADFITKAIKNHQDENYLTNLKNDVIELCKKFPIYEK